MRMHDVFHVSLLKEFRSNGTVAPPPLPQTLAGDLEYEVEQIIDCDTSRKKYHVKRLGYGHESNTWEPEKNLKHEAQLLLKRLPGCSDIMSSDYMASLGSLCQTGTRDSLPISGRRYVLCLALIRACQPVFTLRLMGRLSKLIGCWRLCFGIM